MPGSDPAAQTLDVPGARLYYERRGAGPLLLMIGSPMDSIGFAGLARALADRYTTSRPCGRRQPASWSPLGPPRRASSPTVARWPSRTGSVRP